MDSTIKVFKPSYGYAMQNNLKNEDGFTLVELLIAALIISIGILALGKTLGGSTKNRAVSSDITFASELATAETERLALNINSKVGNYTSGNRTEYHQGVPYNLVWITDSDSGIWIIDMTVTWPRYGSKSINYQRLVTGG